MIMKHLYPFLEIKRARSHTSLNINYNEIMLLFELIYKDNLEDLSNGQAEKLKLIQLEYENLFWVMT